MREIHATRTQSVPIDQAGFDLLLISHGNWLKNHLLISVIILSSIPSRVSMFCLRVIISSLWTSIVLWSFTSWSSCSFTYKQKEKRGNCVETRWFFRSWMSSCLEQLVERISDIAFSITTSRWKSHKISRAIIHSRCNACELLMEWKTHFLSCKKGIPNHGRKNSLLRASYPLLGFPYCWGEKLWPAKSGPTQVPPCGHSHRQYQSKVTHRVHIFCRKKACVFVLRITAGGGLKELQKALDIGQVKRCLFQQYFEGQCKFSWKPSATDMQVIIGYFDLSSQHLPTWWLTLFSNFSSSAPSFDISLTVPSLGAAGFVGIRRGGIWK